MDASKEQYQPIDCGFHDQLLELATLRQAATIAYRDDQGNTAVVRDVIEDVFTRAGAEYLRLRSGLVIRLDKLVEVDR